MANNIEDEINNLYKLLEENYSLSKVIPRTLPICLELSEYGSFYVLSLLTMPIVDNSGANGAQRENIQKSLRNVGLPQSEIDKIAESSEEYYLQIKSIDKEGNIIGYSVLEMEKKISEDDLALKELYRHIRNAQSSERKQYYTQQYEKTYGYKQQLDKQYGVLSSYVSGILASLRSKENMTKSVEKSSAVTSKNVFIIYGHDEAKRRELSNLLKDRFHLNPIVLQDEPSGGKTIIEKFESIASACSFAIALVTPDDMVNDSEGVHKQARPNVIFELGWFYGHLGRSHVVILYKDDVDNQIFSDLDGVMRIQYHSDVSEKYLDLEKELKEAGVIN